MWGSMLSLRSVCLLFFMLSYACFFKFFDKSFCPISTKNFGSMILRFWRRFLLNLDDNDYESVAYLYHKSFVMKTCEVLLSAFDYDLAFFFQPPFGSAQSETNWRSEMVTIFFGRGSRKVECQDFSWKNLSFDAGEVLLIEIRWKEEWILLAKE